MKPGQITAKADTKQVKQFKKRFSFIVQTEYNFSDWVPIFLLLTGISRQQTIFLIHLIFGSMVGWLDGSTVPWFDRHLWLQRCAVSGLLSCRACFSLRSNPPFCFALKICAEIVVHRMFVVFLNGLNGKNSSRSIVRNICSIYIFIQVSRLVIASILL